MTRADPWRTRPFTDQRFSGGGHYNRPQLGIWRIWLWRDIAHAGQALTLTGVAAAAAVTLAGLRVWRSWTEPTDQIGD